MVEEGKEKWKQFVSKNVRRENFSYAFILYHLDGWRGVVFFFAAEGYLEKIINLEINKIHLFIRARVQGLTRKPNIINSAESAMNERQFSIRSYVDRQRHRRV